MHFAQQFTIFVHYRNLIENVLGLVVNVLGLNTCKKLKIKKISIAIFFLFLNENQILNNGTIKGFNNYTSSYRKNNPENMKKPNFYTNVTLT